VPLTGKFVKLDKLIHSGTAAPLIAIDGAVVSITIVLVALKRVAATKLKLALLLKASLI